MQKLSSIPHFEDLMKQIKERETKICPTCKNPVNDPIGKEFLENVGECADCDSIRSDHDCKNSADDGCNWEGHHEY